MENPVKDDPSLLQEAMMAKPGDMIQASAEDVREVASRGFFDGLKMAAAITDDPELKAKLWALISAQTS